MKRILAIIGLAYGCQAMAVDCPKVIADQKDNPRLMDSSEPGAKADQMCFRAEGKTCYPDLHIKPLSLWKDVRNSDGTRVHDDMGNVVSSWGNDPDAQAVVRELRPETNAASTIRSYIDYDLRGLAIDGENFVATIGFHTMQVYNIMFVFGTLQKGPRGTEGTLVTWANARPADLCNRQNIKQFWYTFNTQAGFSSYAELVKQDDRTLAETTVEVVRAYLALHPYKGRAVSAAVIADEELH